MNCLISKNKKYFELVRESCVYTDNDDVGTLGLFVCPEPLQEFLQVVTRQDGSRYVYFLLHLTYILYCFQLPLGIRPTQSDLNK